MSTAADLSEDKNEIVKKTSTISESFATNTHHTTGDIWRGVRTWFTGFPKRFDDFQCLNGTFKNIFVPEKNRL